MWRMNVFVLFDISVVPSRDGKRARRKARANDDELRAIVRIVFPRLGRTGNELVGELNRLG